MVHLRVLITVLLPLLASAYEKTVCELQLETISCLAGQVIQVTSVLYGRTDRATCNVLNSPFSSLNCRSTQISTNTVLSWCQGRSTCLVHAFYLVLGEDPCPGTPKYLKIQYQCVQQATKFPPTTPTTTLPTTTQTPPTTPTSTASTSTSTISTRTTPTSTLSTKVTSPPSANQNLSGVPRDAKVCHEYLVSGPRGVPDSQLTSSSELSPSNAARRGRLYLLPQTYPNGFQLAGGWTASTSDTQPWLQVKLNWPSLVQGVTTQGRHGDPATGCCSEWTTRYKVRHSVDGVTFDPIVENGIEKIFVGNTDTDTIVTHMFPCPITARFLRVYVIDYVTRPSMRLEVLGCPANIGDLGTCPAGWKERPGSSTCYLVSDQSDFRTWEEAEIKCLRSQGHLVKIDSFAERDWLRTEMRAILQTQPLQNWWVGLNNRPRFDNKNFQWTDHSPLDKAIINWSFGEPNNAGSVEHCGSYYVTSNTMSDLNCDTRLPYICEKDKYWNTPINRPGLVTMQPTLPSTAAPTTAIHKIPIPIGGGIVTSGNNIFATGCLNQTDCAGKAFDDYQSCVGCGYYQTCAPGNQVFVRPCPRGLKYDDYLQACTQLSSTCQGP